MNNIVKGILIGIGGATVGSVVTFFITKKVMEDKMYDKITDAVNEYKETHPVELVRQTTVSQLRSTRLKRQQEQQNKLVNEIIENKKKIAKDINNDFREVIPEQQYSKEEEINYAHGDSDLYPREFDMGEGEDEIKDHAEQMEEDFKEATKNDSDYDENGEIIPDENEEEDLDVEDLTLQNRDNIKPYCISANEYEEDNGYIKSHVSYYEGDDTLADDDDKVIHHINDAVGDDFINHFGDMSGDASLAYIRNEKYSIDYEVQLVHGSYKNIARNNVGSPSQNSFKQKIQKYKASRKNGDDY